MIKESAVSPLDIKIISHLIKLNLNMGVSGSRNVSAMIAELCFRDKKKKKKENERNSLQFIVKKTLSRRRDCLVIYRAF